MARVKTSLPNPLEGASEREQATQGLPASYRDCSHRKHLIVAAGIPHIKDDLNVKRLNEIHRWLKLAGLSMPPRSLNYQRARLRSIIACEQTDMHLVWAPGYIFIKPLPDYLLDAKFWTDHLTGDKDLYGLCMGLLLSYTALIQYRSDFVIAKNEGLIKDSLEWEDWVKHSAAVLAQTNPTVNKRYKYGELRMSRLNKILWAHFQLRGYRFPYQTYGEMFISNMVPIAGATIYAVLVLTAMQVGLATDALQENDAFQKASYGFAILSIVAPIGIVAFVVLVIALHFCSNLVHTYTFRFRNRGSTHGGSVKSPED